MFETETQAKAAAPPESGLGMGGVKLDTVQFGPVVGAAENSRFASAGVA